MGCDSVLYFSSFDFFTFIVHFQSSVQVTDSSGKSRERESNKIMHDSISIVGENQNACIRRCILIARLTKSSDVKFNEQKNKMSL